MEEGTDEIETMLLNSLLIAPGIDMIEDIDFLIRVVDIDIPSS